MLIKQLSIFVENRQGKMAEITETLFKNKIDIRALSIADTTDYGILRLIVNNPEIALEALKKEGITVSLTNVIAIAISDVTGGLNKAVMVLTEAGIAIEYMYAFLNPHSKTASVILRVEDNEKAIGALQSGGIEIMTSEQVYKI